MAESNNNVLEKNRKLMSLKTGKSEGDIALGKRNDARLHLRLDGISENIASLYSLLNAKDQKESNLEQKLEEILREVKSSRRRGGGGGGGTVNLDEIKGVGWTDETLVTIQALIETNLDEAISAAEGNIRGADDDTLKTLSDAIDALGGNALIAVQGTATGNGEANGTTIIDVGLMQDDDHWNGLQVKMTSGNCEGQTQEIVDFDNATGTLTVSPGFTEQILLGDEYDIITVRSGESAVIGLASMIVSIRSEATDDGAVDGSTLIDAARTEASDWWNDDYEIMILGGTSNSEVRRIVDFDAATDTITVYPAFKSQILDTTPYVILPCAGERRMRNHLVTRMWPSDPQATATVDTTHTDASLPSVTLPDIEGEIDTVLVVFSAREIENTDDALNMLSGAQEIQVKESVGGAWTDCIRLKDNMFPVIAESNGPMQTIIGAIDVSGEVAAFNKTYNFQWDEPLCDADSLIFKDVQMFLIVSYY